jgi:hypothetical protein
MNNVPPTPLAHAGCSPLTLSEDLALKAPARSTPERDQRVHNSLSSSSCWWLLLMALITALLCMPFIRVVYSMVDEGVLLNGAERMLRGGRLYVDFFEFLPPGGFLLAEVWFKIVGLSFGSARLLAILTIVGIACFTFLACWRVSKNAPLSAFLTTGWVVMSQGAWTQVSHHWLTTLLSMMAAWAVLTKIEHAQRWLRWPLIAGAAVGMAAMVNPHRGALAALAAVTAFLNLRRHPAQLIAYGLGCALAPAGVLAYLIGQHALAAAFDDVIRFPIEHYTAINSVPFAFGLPHPLDYPFKYLFTLAALLAFLVCVFDWRACLRDRLLWPCAAFGLAGFLGCFPRPNIHHIAAAAPLAFPLLACCISRLTERWRLVWWRHRCPVPVLAGVVVIGFCAPYVGFFAWMSREAINQQIVTTSRGSVAFYGHSGAADLLARIAATPSGDAYFFYPVESMLAFLSAREQVSKYDLFLPEYTSRSQYQDACVSVMRHASWVVINRRATDPNILKQSFPALRDAEPEEKKRFEEALNSGFELVAQEGVFELRHRRAGISDTLCGGIAK